MSNSLVVEERGNALIIRFNRPEVRNPLSIEVVERLNEIVAGVGGRQHIDNVIFTGTRGVFAAGADLCEIGSLPPEEASEFARRGQRLMNRIAELPATATAAINGACFGGALDLALACDRRIGSPDATFAHPGTGLGIITGWGGTQRLPRLVGTANALEMFFTALPIDAAHALAIGLIDDIAEDPLAKACEFVTTREVG